MATHNLPEQLTTFVGREPELDAISGLLAQARLVTVAGPGGCGKTRVAVEAASRQADRRPGEICWVDLASTSDPADVPELLAAATGVLLPPDRQAGLSLVRQLADRQMLLCLDNCEHVLAAAAEVAAELMRTCPGVTVLATSREPLGVAGETVWRVPPLRGDDAVALFEERSGHAVRSEESAAAVCIACIRLDGIPLAVELAAAWSGTLSATEILQGLDDRFALLIRGPRGMPARHQTLAASMAWSHDLLDEADRVLFRRLGAFPGGFTLKAAQGVCAFEGSDEMDVRSGLRRLVDKSLVVADTRGATARYRMLETIRQYAVARLDEAGERDSTQDRHLDTFLALTDEAAPLLDVDKDAWRAAIGAVSENLRAAVEWGLSRDDAERGRRLAAALPWLWHLSARGHEGLALLQLAITKDPGARTEVQARLLAGLALVADTTRPDAMGHDAAAAALEIATEVGDERTACLAQLLSALSFLHRDLDSALSLAEGAHERARDAGDAFVSDGAMALVGIIWHLRDEHQKAIPVLQMAVDGLVQRGDRGVASTAIGFMACSVLYTGDVAMAHELAVQGMQVARPLADYHRLGSALSVLAMVVGITGHVDDGRATLGPVLRSVEGADLPPFVPGLARTMGFLELWSRRPDQAAAWFRREASWREGDDAAGLSPQTSIGLAAALRLLGDTAAAATRCEQAVATARLVGMPRVVADALEQSALLISETDARRAEDLHHEALALRVEHGLRLFYVDSLEAIAALAARAESFTEAVRLLGASDRARTEMFYPRTTELAADVNVLREALGPEAYDAAWHQGRALSLDDAVNGARRARGTRGRPSSGWASLTPTEHSVVRLVVDGSSNPEIGTRLFMSRSTVKTHLSHVYAKLGVANRTELATFAGPHLADG
jgi:predicted ATPase/DNA-binding CsgD family transcriptional regulator